MKESEKFTRTIMMGLGYYGSDSDEEEVEILEALFNSRAFAIAMEFNEESGK